MPKDNGQTGEEGDVRTEKDEGHEDSEKPFRHIQNERTRAQSLAAGAQGVRGTDVAGPGLSQIALAHEPGQDQAEGNAAEQIGCQDHRQENLPAVDHILPVRDGERRLKTAPVEEQGACTVFDHGFLPG